jgi:tRNA modification GTPase
MSGASPEGRASLLTPTGRGAVAVIAAEGPAAHAAVDAHFRAANCLQLSAQRIDRILFGHWTNAVNEDVDERDAPGEEVIVCRTSKTALEIHCHGGVAATERILAALTAHGCRCEPWAEWVRAHAGSSLEAEADLALAKALTRRTAALLLDQQKGALQREIDAIVGGLLSGEASRVTSARNQLAVLCDSIPLGQHLIQPWQIAIAGRPNVGKSSLINALVGYERAIVFDQPGTTRDVLAADSAIDGWPVRLTDSAGLRTTTDPLEAAGVELAYERLEQADLVLWVLDAATLTPTDLAAPLDAAHREIAAELSTPLRHDPLVVLNKADLVLNAAELAATRPLSSTVATCALTGAGIPALFAAIAGRLVPRVPRPGGAVPFTECHAAALAVALKLLDADDVAGAASTLSQMLQ